MSDAFNDDLDIAHSSCRSEFSSIFVKASTLVKTIFRRSSNLRTVDYRETTSLDNCNIGPKRQAIRSLGGQMCNCLSYTRSEHMVIDHAFCNLLARSAAISHMACSHSQHGSRHNVFTFMP